MNHKKRVDEIRPNKIFKYLKPTVNDYNNCVK